MQTSFQEMARVEFANKSQYDFDTASNASALAALDHF
jgi:hypothetical protein